MSRSPLHAVRLADRWVVLDAAGGEYLTVPDHDPPPSPDEPPGAPARDSVAALQEALAHAGLAGRPLRTAARAPAPLEEEESAATLQGATVRAAVLFALSLAVTAWDLSRPFAELVRPRGLRSRSRDGAEAAQEAARFARFLVWSPWQGECLFRSRWLLRYLQLQGCPADWVFGVRGWPLQAHCWVRCGGRLLNETPGAVLAYRELAVF